MRGRWGLGGGLPGGIMSGALCDGAWHRRHHGVGSTCGMRNHAPVQLRGAQHAPHANLGAALQDTAHYRADRSTRAALLPHICSTHNRLDARLGSEVYECRDDY